MRRILRKILAGEEDQLGDITTVSSHLSVSSRGDPWANNSSSYPIPRSSRKSSPLFTRARNNFSLQPL
jgi:hypothetical protein